MGAGEGMDGMDLWGGSGSFLTCFVPLVAVVAVVVLAYRVLVNADFVDSDRRTAQQRRQLMSTFKMPVRAGLRYDSRYVSTKRGRIMFTQTFSPEHTPARGILCYCHGYTENLAWSAAPNAQRLSLATGMAVAFIDYHGHGLSDGLSTLVTDFHELVDDVVTFFRSTRSHFGKQLPLYLYGNSMGGAVALHAALAHPGLFAGAILVAPMVQIADEIRPKEPVKSAVIWLSRLFPWAAVTPTPDLMELCVRDPAKKEYILRNPINFRARGRLATARECYFATVELEQRLADIRIPFIVLHGAMDVVTSPNASRLLHAQASSTDKTIKIYPNKLHALTTGEPDDSVTEVMQDMAMWLNQRLAGAGDADHGVGVGGLACHAASEVKPSVDTALVGVKSTTLPQHVV